MAVLAGPVADLATAMVVARAERDKASATQMIQRTIEVWRTPHLIEAYRAYERAQSFYGAYDEAYLESPLASRFVETKFHDNALHFASLLQNDDSREQLRRMTVESFWATLPTPLLRSLGIGINKAELEFSLGDYLVYLARGLPLGGYKIGSVFAHGQLLFGIAFPLVYVLLCLLLFSFMSLLTVQQDDGTARVTTLACMRLWAFFFYGITAEGLRPLFSFITRDFIQMAILYCIIYSLVRVVVREREGAAAPVPA